MSVLGPVDRAAGDELDRRRRFESIAHTVHEPVQRYLGRRANAADVPDLLNDVLLVIWRRLDDVPTGNPLPWSYGVARRCVANLRRTDARRLRLVNRVGAATLTAEPAQPIREGHTDVALALERLDDDERELIRLWAWEQLEPREIAVVLDTTANAVSLRLTRVKRKLSATIARQDAGHAGHKGSGHQRSTGRER
jgi:RNA polymerase sigma-70 factor (ECF subfamily)